MGPSTGMVKKVGPRLRELAPPPRPGSVITQPRAHLFLPSLYLQYKDGESVLSIFRQGQHEASPLDKLYNDRIFSGSENDLMLAHVYSTMFSCSFRLDNFPFDTQHCKMQLKLLV